jgi:hypothetical protein
MVGEGATGSVFFWAITGRWSLIPGQLLRARVRSARHPSPGSPAATLRPWPPPKWSAGRSAVDVRPANVRERPGSESWKRDQPPVDGLGLASWLCHPRAQAVEQNGSPFLTAMSGRSLPQHGQRPSRRGEGSGRIDGWLSNVGRRLSLALADGTVMPPPRWSGRLSRAKCLALQVESCSPRLHRLARVKRVGRLRASAGVLAAGPDTHKCTPPATAPRAGRCYVGRGAQDSRSSSSVSSHSRQIHSRSPGVHALSTAGTIVTPQAGQIGGRPSYTSEVSAVCLQPPGHVLGRPPGSLPGTLLDLRSAGTGLLAT